MSWHQQRLGLLSPRVVSSAHPKLMAALEKGCNRAAMQESLQLFVGHSVRK